MEGDPLKAALLAVPRRQPVMLFQDQPQPRHKLGRCGHEALFRRGCLMAIC
jgi:hypothetical protein